MIIIERVPIHSVHEIVILLLSLPINLVQMNLLSKLDIIDMSDIYLKKLYTTVGSWLNISVQRKGYVGRP